jgi:hypothetical protein
VPLPLVASNLFVSFYYFPSLFASQIYLHFITYNSEPVAESTLSAARVQTEENGEEKKETEEGQAAQNTQRKDVGVVKTKR